MPFPTIHLTNRTDSVRSGNVMLELKRVTYEIGIAKDGECQFVSMWDREKEGQNVTVYRYKLAPSQIRRYRFVGANSSRDLKFKRLSSQQELNHMMAACFVEYGSELIDLEIVK